MKKWKLLVTLFIGLSIISCSSDDDNVPVENPQANSEFTSNGTNYSTANGYINSDTYLTSSNNIIVHEP